MRSLAGGRAAVGQFTAIALVLCSVFVLASIASAAGLRGSRGSPIPVRVTFPIPSSKGWTVRVNKSAADIDLTQAALAARRAVGLPAIGESPAVRAAVSAVLAGGDAQGAFTSKGG